MKPGHTSSLPKILHPEKNPSSWEALPDLAAAPESLALVHRAAALSASLSVTHKHVPTWDSSPSAPARTFLQTLWKMPPPHPPYSLTR